jgi:hypothetical protein
MGMIKVSVVNDYKFPSDAYLNALAAFLRALPALPARTVRTA